VELSQKIQQIRGFRGQKRYNELEGIIDSLEKRLVKINPGKYQDDIIQEINQNLTQKGVKKDYLSSDTKNDLAKIENGEIKDFNQILSIKEKAYQEIGQKGAENKLIKILASYEKKSSDPGTKKKLKAEIYRFYLAAKSNEFYR
jgi:hypothetical protein